MTVIALSGTARSSAVIAALRQALPWQPGPAGGGTAPPAPAIPPPDPVRGTPPADRRPVPLSGAGRGRRHRWRRIAQRGRARRASDHGERWRGGGCPLQQPPRGPGRSGRRRGDQRRRDDRRSGRCGAAPSAAREDRWARGADRPGGQGMATGRSPPPRSRPPRSARRRRRPRKRPTVRRRPSPRPPPTRPRTTVRRSGPWRWRSSASCCSTVSRVPARPRMNVRMRRAPDASSNGCANWPDAPPAPDGAPHRGPIESRNGCCDRRPDLPQGAGCGMTGR